MKTKGALSAARWTTNTTHAGPVMNGFRLLIDGRLVEGAGTLEVINPATGRALTTAPRASRAQLEEAVAAGVGLVIHGASLHGWRSPKWR
jgi:hypothetical protein